MNWNQVIEQAAQYKGDIYGTDIEKRNHFNKVFLYFLEKHNVTQAAVAKALNKTTVTINHWAKNRTYPTLKTIMKIKAYFDNLDASKI